MSDEEFQIMIQVLNALLKQVKRAVAVSEETNALLEEMRKELEAIRKDQ